MVPAPPLLAKSLRLHFEAAMPRETGSRAILERFRGNYGGRWKPQGRYQILAGGDLLVELCFQGSVRRSCSMWVMVPAVGVS